MRCWRRTGPRDLGRLRGSFRGNLAAARAAEEGSAAGGAEGGRAGAPGAARLSTLATRSAPSGRGRAAPRKIVGSSQAAATGKAAADTGRGCD